MVAQEPESIDKPFQVRADYIRNLRKGDTAVFDYVYGMETVVDIEIRNVENGFLGHHIQLGHYSTNGIYNTRYVLRFPSEPITVAVFDK